jgi:hypothetical protein
MGSARCSGCLVACVSGEQFLDRTMAFILIGRMAE